MQIHGGIIRIIMSTDSKPSPTIEHLAERLKRDIKIRRMREGEPYLTATTAAETLGVSRMTANRVLNVLAGENIVVRHQRHGTFVGPAVSDTPTTTSGHVAYFSFADLNPDLAFPVGKMVAGLRRVMPDVAFLPHFISPREGKEYVHRVLDSVADSADCRGIIASLCTREIQQVLAESRLPIVLFGTAEPGIDLPSLDVDQHQAGRLLAEEAIREGIERLVYVNRQVWRRGDTELFNGVLEAVQASDLPPDSLTVLNCASDAESITAELEVLLENTPAPFGVLMQVAHFGEAVLKGAHRLGISVPSDIRIFFADDGNWPESIPSTYLNIRPSVRCSEDMADQFERIGRILLQLRKGEKPSPTAIKIPMERIK